MTYLAPIESFRNYAARLADAVERTDWDALAMLALALQECLRERRQVFLCGNGGSAANALHIANDLFYGMTRRSALRLRVHALPSNVSLLTCLANDEGYDAVFSEQLKTFASRGDVLIVLSGSGNSPNIIRVLEEARGMGVRSFAILGYSGGRALPLADHALHYKVDDMQIAEDLQVIVGHMLMQWIRDGDGQAE